jgi:hypothetical protein
MIHAKMFALDAENAKQSFTLEHFDFANGEEGSSEPLAGLDVSDRPLFVQVRLRRGSGTESVLKVLVHSSAQMNPNGC